MSADAFRSVAEIYNLKSEDLRKAANRINHFSGLTDSQTRPATCKHRSYTKRLIEGKYIELSTIWTAADPDSKGKNKQRVWRPRHIGVWSSKQNERWIFLVLIAPLSTDGDTPDYTEDSFNFCLNDLVGEYVEKPLAVMIDWFGQVLSDASRNEEATAELLEKATAELLEKFMNDVMWSWESYLARIKKDIREVYVPKYVR